MGCLFRTVFGLVGVVVLAAGAAYVALQQKPTIATGLTPIVASAEAAKSFDDKVSAAVSAAVATRAQGSNAPVEVAFNEQELTSKVRQSADLLQNSALSATSTEIHLAGSDLIATSTITVQGFSVNIGMVATPQVVNGKSQFVVKDLQTGLIPLPDAVKVQINKQIQDALDPASLGLPLDLSAMTIADGKLVIRGTTSR